MRERPRLDDEANVRMATANIVVRYKIEMSPMRVMTESSHALFSVEGVLLCRGFGQGRAPYLRAPEGSLDGTNGTAHNAETGNGWTPPCVRGHFYRAHKGT